MCPKCRGSAFARSAEVLQIQSAELLHLGEVQRFCIWAKCRGSAFARSAEVLQIQSAEVLHLGEVQVLFWFKPWR